MDKGFYKRNLDVSQFNKMNNPQTLSDKIRIAQKVDNLYRREMIEAVEVKDFIKKLKEEINKPYKLCNCSCPVLIGSFLGYNFKHSVWWTFQRQTSGHRIGTCVPGRHLFRACSESHQNVQERRHYLLLRRKTCYCRRDFCQLQRLYAAEMRCSGLPGVILWPFYLGQTLLFLLLFITNLCF
jgi:hypothetical protein